MVGVEDDRLPIEGVAEAVRVSRVPSLGEAAGVVDDERSRRDRSTGRSATTAGCGSRTSRTAPCCDRNTALPPGQALRRGAHRAVRRALRGGERTRSSRESRGRTATEGRIEHACERRLDAWRGKVGAPPELPDRPAPIDGAVLDQSPAPSAVRVALGSAVPNLGCGTAGHKRRTSPRTSLIVTPHSQETPCASSEAHSPANLFGRGVRLRSYTRSPQADGGPSRFIPGGDGLVGVGTAASPISAALPLRLAPLPLLGDAGLLRGAGRLGRPPLLLDDERAANQLGQARLGGLAVLLLAATRARDDPEPSLAVEARGQPLDDERARRRRPAPTLRPGFQSSSIRVLDVFTCWPPAPPARDARYSSSAARDRERRCHLQRAFLAHRVTPLVDQSSSERTMAECQNRSS